MPSTLHCVLALCGKSWFCSGWTEGLHPDAFRQANAIDGRSARAAVVAKARQAIEAVFLIEAIPSGDRVVVEKQHLGDSTTAHALIQQRQRVGPAGQAMRIRAIACQLDQVASRFRV